MKNKKILPILFFALTLSAILCSCFDFNSSNDGQAYETSSDTTNSKSEEELRREKWDAMVRDVTPVVDNETPYKYLSTSELTFDDISHYIAFSQIPLEYENKFFRETDGKCYAISSLKDNKLCYVFLRLSEDTGIRYYIKKMVLYPSDDINSDFYNSILEIDYPENILKEVNEQQ